MTLDEVNVKTRCISTYSFVCAEGTAFRSKNKDVVEGADACGTARAGETNVPRSLARWLNTRPTASSPLQRSRKAEAFPLTPFYFCQISCKFCSAVLAILLTNLTPAGQFPKAYKKEAGFPASLNNLIYLPLRTVEVP